MTTKQDTLTLALGGWWTKRKETLIHRAKQWSYARLRSRDEPPCLPCCQLAASLRLVTSEISISRMRLDIPAGAAAGSHKWDVMICDVGSVNETDKTGPPLTQT